MTPTIAEIRRHFRKETGKLDNWLYHMRIDDYFKPTRRRPEGTKKEENERDA